MPGRLTRNQKIYLQWDLIVDLIGPPQLWPKNVRRYFWTKNINHFQRFLVVCFCFVNGLGMMDMIEWVDLMGLCRDDSARHHMLSSLYNSFLEGRYLLVDRYYAYNVNHFRYEYLNGTIGYYTHASERH